MKIDYDSNNFNLMIKTKQPTSILQINNDLISVKISSVTDPVRENKK